MATVRVSAGFRPSKMLLSVRKGREVRVCVCLRRGAGGLPQGIERRTFTREGRRKEERWTHY